MLTRTDNLYAVRFAGGEDNDVNRRFLQMYANEVEDEGTKRALRLRMSGETGSQLTNITDRALGRRASFNGGRASPNAVKKLPSAAPIRVLVNMGHQPGSLMWIQGAELSGTVGWDWSLDILQVLLFIYYFDRVFFR